MESTRPTEEDVQEVDAWLDSLEGLTRERGAPAAGRMLSRLIERGQRLGLTVAGALNTPYVNTIPADVQPAYPGDRSIELKVGDVIWIKAEDYYVLIHSKRGRQLVRTTLSALEQRLDPLTFLRVHRAAIVNVHEVQEIRDENGLSLVLSDGSDVPVSRSRRAHLEAILRSRLR